MFGVADNFGDAGVEFVDAAEDARGELLESYELGEDVRCGDGTSEGLFGEHDTVLVPEGYHPVVSAHGYTTYYLNFLAGSAQSLANSDDPAYAWVKTGWTSLDPRLPIVDLGMEPPR